MLSKSSVGYESPAKGPHHCSECEHFRGPSRCEIVAGTIKPGDWCERWKAMPVSQGRSGVKQEMDKYKSGTLHSGSSKGPIVTNRKQAIAISLSEAGLSKKKGKRFSI